LFEIFIFDAKTNEGEIGLYFENNKKKLLGGATSQKSQKEISKPLYLHYYSSSGDALDFKRSSMIQLSSPYGFGLLFSSQN
jgi:hypothetical protein